MKNYYLLCSILFFVTVSCTNIEQQGRDESSPTGNSQLKGQAATLDEVSQKNILQVAMGSADHTTLVAACKAAGLEDVLSNNGPFTVFAPTNEAFEALPEGTVETLLKPENKDLLRRTIYFHAAPGVYKGNLLKDGSKIYEATGHYVDVVVNENGTYVNGAKILATIEASNGVIHVVDKVFVLPE